MGWCSVGESFHQKTEFAFNFIFFKFQQFKDLVLNISPMNTDTASSDFYSIEGDIISPGANTLRLILSICFKIFQVGHGERMVT